MGTYQDALKRKLNKDHESGPKGQIKPANLHIPKPDPDPKAPTEYKPNKGGKSNTHVGDNKGQQTYTPNGNGNKPGSSSTGNGGGQGNGGNQGNGFLPATDPRDDQYWRDLFTLTQERDLKLQNLDVEDTYARNSFNEAALYLKMQQPKDILGYQEGRNQRGGLYSSRTGEGVGDIVKNYFEQNTSLNRDYERDSDTRRLSRETISNKYLHDSDDLYADAASRASAAETERPMPEGNSILEALLEKIDGGGNQSGGNRQGGNQQQQKPDKDKDKKDKNKKKKK